MVLPPRARYYSCTMQINSKAVFKSYTPNQMQLLPPSLEELIDANHPVRIVNQIIEQIDLEPLLKKYQGGGTSSFHPRMMLKVLVYSYLSNVYSSRKMEAALKENIHFMWLSAMNQPDHNTLNRFRSERLKEVLKELFGKVVELLVASGHVSLKEVYTDGTKIEANANRYTFVWGNAIKTSKNKMEQQLKELWSYAETVAQEELKDQTPTTFAPIDAEQVKQTIKKIDEALADKPVSKKVKEKIKYAKKNWPDKINQYQQQESILGERKSYSKTDHDATFMRMKEDHMKNGQLKPAYNLQISSHDQFVVNYSIHQTTTDTNTLASHLGSHEQLYNKMPEVLTTDAGYGSEENYELLEKHDIETYVKYNTFDKEQKNKKKDEPFKSENLFYNEAQDCFYCPMGQPMNKVGEGTRETTTGFIQHVSYYQALRCEGCPLRSRCHQSQGNRRIEVNHRLRAFKEKVRALLVSEKGVAHRKKRCWDVEPVFANIKHNKNFKRYMLRGKKKVEIETGLLALAHNLAKLAA
jgi:transposase